MRRLPDSRGHRPDPPGRSVPDPATPGRNRLCRLLGIPRRQVRAGGNPRRGGKAGSASRRPASRRGRFIAAGHRPPFIPTVTSRLYFYDCVPADPAQSHRPVQAAGGRRRPSSTHTDFPKRTSQSWRNWSVVSGQLPVASCQLPDVRQESRRHYSADRCSFAFSGNCANRQLTDFRSAPGSPGTAGARSTTLSIRP